MRLGAVAVALALAVAGCAGGFAPGGPASDTPTATPTPDGDTPTATAAAGTATPTATATERPPTPTPRTAGKVSVAGLPLSFDEEQVYRDVVELHGRTYDDAPAVDLRVKPAPSPSRAEQVWDTSGFMLLWGFDDSELGETSIAGLAIQNRVFLYADPVPTERGRKSVLAHEFTHVLQHDTGAFQRSYRGIREGDGNARRVYLAVVEGTATYAQNRYVETNLTGTPTPTTWAAYTENRSRFGTYVVAPYYFGPRYVAQRVDSVANLSAVYDDPPTTTEQVLHGYGPDEEPARPLAVDADASTDEGFYLTDRRTRGELFVRLVLEGQLDADRAADAAAGWGNDRVLAFDEVAGDGSAHAWLLRWDSAGEADEFAAAMGDYLDARGDRSGDRWTDDGTTFDVRRAGDETVVVLAGPDRFLDATSVDGTDGDVTVSVEE
jgi:hypothetical protein